MSRFQSPTSALPRRRGFTLIELLIVVAIVSILSGAFFTVVIFATRQEVETRLHATLRQEGLSVVRAVIRDAHLARVSAESTEGPDASEMDDVLILSSAPVPESPRRQIAYRRVGPRLERLVWRDAASTPTIQALAVHVRDWQVERAGGLVHVTIDLAVSRYAKDFVESYSFTVRPGKTFDGRENATPGAARTSNRRGG